MALQLYIFVKTKPGFIMRKLRITALLLALAVLGISSCAQKTCPTYTDKDTEKTEINEVRV